MANRKQLTSPSGPNAVLDSLLATTRLRVVPDDELREQRISFAYGNAMNSESITKESVRMASDRMRLLARTR